MKRTLPSLVVGTGVLMLIASGWLLFQPRSDSGTQGTFPERIAGVELSQETSGAAAMSEVGDMHGKQFPMRSAWIGRYGGNQITLWIAEAESKAIAGQMLQAMQARIAEGNSPFTPLESFSDGGRVIEVLDGMGQKHYYFQSNDLVIWLAAEPGLADRAIRQVLENYP